MCKHSPGPWRMGRAGRIYSPDEKSFEVQVAIVGDFFDKEIRRYNEARWIADARLIAAAPLMLEALKRIREQCADNDHENWIWRTADQAIKAAEAK